MDKTVILSKIGSHIEQRPHWSHYFDRNNPIAKSNIIARVWASQHIISSVDEEIDAKEKLQRRTVLYSKAYYDLIPRMDGMK
jgi:hypothetical protein